MIPTRQALLRIPTRLTSTIRHASTLLIAEPSTTTTLAPATCSAITAAQKLHSGPITLLNLTSTTDTTTDPSTIPSAITHILNANLPSILAESASTAISQAHALNGYTHIVAPATKFGSHVLPRAAAMLGSSAVTDVVEVLGEATFIRPLYAGNALCKVQCTEADESIPTMITVRSTAFTKADGAGSTADVQTLESEPSALTELVGASVSKSNRPDLASASVVVSGGRGMKNGENFKLLEELADKLNGAVGASRAAVDAGFVPNDLQVGQTGKVVAPDLYIAVGISGAIQHLSGMKDSKTIVAVNNDPEAPIFQVADYGLADDLFKVVPEMTEKL